MDECMGWSHVAFSVRSKEKVIQLTEEIVAAGYQLLSGPRTTGDGYFESCVTDPDGNRVEITE
jgi:lactoylglutathione lyase